MIFLYNIIIQIYVFCIRVASLWNKKAQEWINGRKDLFPELEKNIKPGDQVIWFHCSSAGEFEQGKPLIEELKKQFPSHKILITFFSPSGYNAAKNYACADVISYLPMDNRNNAKKFIEVVNPQLIIFIKYEFWYHHLSAAAFKHIPVLLVSATFRENQVFFVWYGKFYHHILFLFRHIFVQDENSVKLLQSHGIDHCSVSGDTRFDRVKKIASEFVEIELIKEFVLDRPVIVAGSTWEDDEKILSEYAIANKQIKFIIAPHEIDAKHLSNLSNKLINVLFYSQLFKEDKSGGFNYSALNDAQVLIIDQMGLLSRLYKYATIVYVGGGFTKDGIHNILEAAVYGKPVIFGRNYKKYREAKELIALGGAFSIASSGELIKIVDELLTNDELLTKAGIISGHYVSNNTGATEKVIEYIQEKRLLTN